MVGVAGGERERDSGLSLAYYDWHSLLTPLGDRVDVEGVET